MPPEIIDPISLRSVDNPASAPFLIERDGLFEVRLCFENEANRQAYLDTPEEYQRGLDCIENSEFTPTGLTGTYN